MTKVTMPDGTQAEIEDREIVEEKTPWNTFKLDDGTVLKIRLNLISVQRVLEKWDIATGDPWYVVKNDLTIRTRAPAELKAKTLRKTDTQEATEIR